MAGVNPFAKYAVPAAPPEPTQVDSSNPFAKYSTMPVNAAQPAAQAQPQIPQQSADPLPNIALPKPNIGSKPSGVDDLLIKAANTTGIDVNALRAIHRNEDASDDPNAISEAGAIGQMQMMPGTFAAYADKGWSITNSEQNIQASSRYVRKLYRQFNGNWDDVFAAYNAGEYGDFTHNKDAQRYAAQAMANMAQLRKSPWVATTSLTNKGKDVAVVDQMATDIDKNSNPFLQDVGNTAGAVAGGANYGAAALSHAAKSFLGAAYDKIPERDRAKVDALFNSGPVTTVKKGIDVLGGIVGLVPEALDAAFMDASEAGQSGDNTSNKNENTIVQTIWKGLQNPGTLPDALHLLAAHYTPFEKNEQLYWMSRPGVAGLAATNKNADPLDAPFRAVAAVMADTSRNLIQYPALRDIAAFATGWFNPGNHVPGWVLTHTAGPVGRVAQSVAENRFPKGWQTAKAAYTSAVTHMPMGDRFYKTQADASDAARAAGKSKDEADEIGRQAAAKHAMLARQQDSAPHIVRGIFGQPDKLGGLSPAEVKKLWEYHERFFNMMRTSHILRPGAGPKVQPDIVSGAVVAEQGGLHELTDAKGNVVEPTLQDHLDHQFIYTPRPHITMGPHDIAFKALGSEAEQKKFNNFLKQGDWRSAVALHPNITPQEADAFEAALKNATAGMGPAEAWQYSYTAVEHRMLAQISRDAADPRLGVQPIDYVRGKKRYTVFGAAQDAVDRDHQPLGIGGMTTDSRAFFLQRALDGIDNTTRALVPSIADRIVKGNWSRAKSGGQPGAFQQESSLSEQLQAGYTAKAARGDAHGNALGTGPTSTYHSLAEARQFGMQDNPDFNPAVPLLGQMTRSVRLQNYVAAMLKDAYEINYENVFNRTFGKGSSPWTAATGKDGLAELQSKVEKMADDQAKMDLGQGAYDALAQATRDYEVKRRMASIMKQVETTFKQQNPNMSWNMAEETGVQDFTGFTAPRTTINSARDSVPAFHNGSSGLMTLMGDAEPVENMVANGVETAMHFLRMNFLSNVLYHPMQNIARLALTFGELNPVDIAQAFFMPHAIDPKLYKRVEDFGLGYHARSTGGAGAAARYSLAADPKFAIPEKNWLVRQLTIPQRAKAVIDSFSRLDDKQPWLKRGQHFLMNALYHGDKWSQDLVFGVLEDAFTAKVMEKFEKKGYSPEIAASKVRKIFGERENLTESERALGLQRLTWFYNWFKTQMRLAAKDPVNAKMIGLTQGTHNALLAQNSMGGQVVQDPQRDADYGDFDTDIGGKPYQMQISSGVTAPSQAFQSLMSSPVNYGEGAMSFAQYVTTHAMNTLSPDVQTVVYGLPQVLGLSDRKALQQSASGALEQSLGGLAKGLTPQLATILAQAVQDPVRSLQVTGVKVVPRQPGENMMASAMLTMMEKKFKKMFDMQTTDAGRRMVQEEAEKAMQPYMQRISQLKGQ